MTDDCQTAVIVIAHTYTKRTVAHIRTRTDTNTRSVFGLFSLWCFFARRFFFFQGEFFLSFFFYFRVLLFQKTLFSFFFVSAFEKFVTQTGLIL